MLQQDLGCMTQGLDGTAQHALINARVAALEIVGKQLVIPSCNKDVKGRVRSRVIEDASSCCLKAVPSYDILGVCRDLKCWSALTLRLRTYPTSVVGPTQEYTYLVMQRA